MKRCVRLEQPGLIPGSSGRVQESKAAGGPDPFCQRFRSRPRHETVLPEHFSADAHSVKLCISQQQCPCRRICIKKTCDDIFLTRPGKCIHDVKITDHKAKFRLGVVNIGDQPDRVFGASMFHLDFSTGWHKAAAHKLNRKIVVLGQQSGCINQAALNLNAV